MREAGRVALDSQRPSSVLGVTEHGEEKGNCRLSQAARLSGVWPVDSGSRRLNFSALSGAF